MSDVFTINHLPGRTISHEGRDYIFFSGTAYLGLPQHPAFGQLLSESLTCYGTSYGSSRNGNLRLGVYEAAEAKLATLTRTPDNRPAAALTLSSGMMAGQLTVNWLRGQNARFVYGPKAHPALWHAPVVDLPALPFADWSRKISQQLGMQTSAGPDASTALERDRQEPVAILVNSVDAGRSEYFDFRWVNDLPDDWPITLVVDDSHGLGVLNEGRGIWPQIPRKPNVRLLVTASLAKAMGLPGGAIFGDTETINALRQTAFFGASSPMSPAYLDAFLRADALYAEGHDRLRRNINQAEKRLLPTGLFRHAPGYPVFFTEHNDLYTYLLENEIFIYSFAYPTATDRPNTRIVISAFHEPEDIDQLADAVDAFRAKIS